jgi:hypothetical protein
MHKYAPIESLGGVRFTPESGQAAKLRSEGPSQEPCLSASVLLKKEENDMFKSLDIQEHMEVVGSDGKHVGTVDHKESGDHVMLTKDDPKAGGHHHLISIDWVDYVDRKVHLNKPSQKAIVEWQTVA